MHTIEFIFLVGFLAGATAEMRRIMDRYLFREILFETVVPLALYTAVALMLLVRSDAITFYEDLGGFIMVLAFVLMYPIHIFSFLFGVIMGIVVRSGVLHVLAYLRSRL